MAQAEAQRQLEAALDYRRSLGLAGAFVDRVFADWRRATRRPRSRCRRAPRV